MTGKALDSGLECLSACRGTGLLSVTLCSPACLGVEQLQHMEALSLETFETWAASRILGSLCPGWWGWSEPWALVPVPGCNRVPVLTLLSCWGKSVS